MTLRKGQLFSAANEHQPARNNSKIFFVFFRVYSRLNFLRAPAILTCALFLCVGISIAQTKKPSRKTPATKKQTIANLPKVTQIDAEALKNLLKPNGKPLLINFWATWCDPCREEFPDLVKIAADYKNKIDLITISLDALSDINGDVPKFLAQMKSDSPAYLLKVPDEGEAIAVVAKDWQGGLPFTIFFDADGKTIYSKQGKFKTETLRMEIDRTIKKPVEGIAFNDLEKKSIIWNEVEQLKTPRQKGKDDAHEDILAEKLQIINYGEQSVEKIKLKNRLKISYGVEMQEFGCKMSDKLIEYVKGYNEISETEVKRRFGTDA